MDPEEQEAFEQASYRRWLIDSFDTAAMMMGAAGRSAEFDRLCADLMDTPDDQAGMDLVVGRVVDLLTAAPMWATTPDPPKRPPVATPRLGWWWRLRAWLRRR